jgi:hypothetical protein
MMNDTLAEKGCRPTAREARKIFLQNPCKKERKNEERKREQQLVAKQLFEYRS